MTSIARKRSTHLTYAQRKPRSDRTYGSANGNPPRREPPQADYTDVVSDKQLEAIAECLKEEFDGEELELVSGPAW